MGKELEVMRYGSFRLVLGDEGKVFGYVRERGEEKVVVMNEF